MTRIWNIGFNCQGKECVKNGRENKIIKRLIAQEKVKKGKEGKKDADERKKQIQLQI